MFVPRPIVCRDRLCCIVDSQNRSLPPHKKKALVFKLPVFIHYIRLRGQSFPSAQRALSSFLVSRHEKVRDASGNVITEGFFYVGAEITFHGHCFRITGADDKTLRLMEERANAPGGFVHSDPVRAAELLAGWVEGRAGQVRAFLRERDLKVGTEGSKRQRRRDTVIVVVVCISCSVEQTVTWCFAI